MNFGIRLSLRVEEIMDELRTMPANLNNHGNDHGFVWTEDDERDIYNEALTQALEESNGIAWASGDIHIGELILIIDSDTRVPEDCFLDAASYVVYKLLGPNLTDFLFWQGVQQFTQYCHYTA